MMDISPFAFYIFASISVIFSLMVVIKRNPIASVFSLMVVFFAFAGIYAMQKAHLIAVLQILIYAGAVIVLFIFVIMLLNADIPSISFKKSNVITRLVSVFFALLLFIMFSLVFIKSGLKVSKTGVTEEQIIAAGGNTRVLSELMFSKYILPFELTSALLLGAIVGSVYIAKRSKKMEDLHER